MAYMTIGEAHAHFERAFGRTVAVSDALRSVRRPRPSTQQFDVFLSHCSLDLKAVLGLLEYLTQSGLDVYVDSVDDPQLDRSQVTARTADVIRQRMRHCRSLYFATSDASPTSKWMPWELGHFDGFHPARVAIVPLVASASQTFAGQEYLGLYPTLDLVATISGGRVPRIKDSRGRGWTTLGSFNAGTAAYAR